MSMALFFSEDSAYDVIRKKVEKWANENGYDDFIVTINLNGEPVSELLVCDEGSLVWLNDWWEGEKADLVGFIPLSCIYCVGEPPKSWEVHSNG